MSDRRNGRATGRQPGLVFLVLAFGAAHDERVDSPEDPKPHDEKQNHDRDPSHGVLQRAHRLSGCLRRSLYEQTRVVGEHALMASLCVKKTGYAQSR